MDQALHPLASHDLPSFITAPGETDVLLVVTAAILIIAVVAVGVLYFNLHSLPERMSHKTNRVQVEIVAVLCLLALFTHNHLFWIFALLLAFVRIPDFETPLYTIADSLRRMSGPAAPPSEPPAPAESRKDAAEGEGREA